MSQRTLKYTVCGGDHSIFHCENKCGVCHGDNRQCSCPEWPPQKKQMAKSSSTAADVSYSELRAQSTGAKPTAKRPGRGDRLPHRTAATSTHSLANIHERYDQVLEVMQENRCSMACAFRLASCPRSTLRDFVAIAELKKVNVRELDLLQRDQQVSSVRELEAVCRKRLRRYIPVMNNMRREGKLLPLKFDERFYE